MISAAVMAMSINLQPHVSPLSSWRSEFQQSPYTHARKKPALAPTTALLLFQQTNAWTPKYKHSTLLFSESPAVSNAGRFCYRFAGEGKHLNLALAFTCHDNGHGFAKLSTAATESSIGLTATVMDMGCTALVMAGAYGLVSFFDVLTKGNMLDQKLSRKFVHILSGLLFMMAWPFFSASADARYIAAIVPLANFLRLLIYGLKLAANEGLVNAVSREGRPEELLRGPLYYVLALIFCTIFFWRESPVGVVSLAMMCGGDGIADIIGRRFGQYKLPYNNEKSWAGSIAMFLFGFSISLGILCYLSLFGFIQLDWETAVRNVAIISMAATVVESLPVTWLLDDNISVPSTCILVGLCLFPTQSSYGIL